MHTCPRRQHQHEEGLDKWKPTTNTCSYCGSLEPKAFLKMVEAGTAIIPTDKAYKAYIGNFKFYFFHLDTQQQEHFIELYNMRTMQIFVPGYFYVLPFFMKVNSNG